MRNTITKRIIIVAMIVCLIVVACALASCSIKKKALDDVNAESIKYDGQVIEWDAVKKADSYAVDVNGVSYTVTDTKLEVVSTTNTTISILAKANEKNKRYVDAENAASATFTAAGPVTVSYEGGLFTWTAAEGYTEYICEQGNIGAPFRYKGTSIAPAHPVGVNTASLRVKPYVTADHTFAIWSNTKSVTILSDPENIQYNNLYQMNAESGLLDLTSLITWDKVDGATGYKIELEGKEDSVPASVNTYVYTPKAVVMDNYSNQTEHYSFWVKITALGSDQDVLDSNTVEKTFVYLRPVDKASILGDKGMLTWTASPNATKYNIYVEEDISGKVSLYETSNNYLDVDAEGNYVFEANKKYNVKVQPGTYDGSTYSVWESSEVKFMAAPVLDWNATGDEVGNILWQAVDGVTDYGYVIYKNGTMDSSEGYPISLITDQTQENAFTWGTAGGNELLPGEYYFYCYSKTGAGGVASSRYSDPIHVVQLYPVDAVTFATKDDIENNTVASTAYVTYNLPKYADGVRAVYGGVEVDDQQEVEDTENTTDITHYYENTGSAGYRNAFDFDFAYGMTPGNSSYTNKGWLKIYATYDNAGNKEYDADGTIRVILNARTEYKTTFEQMSTPSNITCLSDVIRWSTVANANGYCYKIVHKNTAGDIVLDSTGTTFGTSLAVPSELSDGLHVFYVAARGNGNIAVTSFYSNPYYLYKLATPKYNVVNKEVQELNADGQLVWVGSEDIKTEYNDDVATSSVTIPEDKDFKIVEGLTFAVQYSVYVSSRMEREFVSDNKYIFRPSDILISGTTANVRAVGANDEKLQEKLAVISSDTTPSVRLYRLETPQAPIVTDTTITFKKITDAGMYELRYDDQVVGRLLANANSLADPVFTIDPTGKAPESIENGVVSLWSLNDIGQGSARSFSLVAKPDPAGKLNYVKKTESDYSVYYFESLASVSTDILVLEAPVASGMTSGVKCDPATGKLEWLSGGNNVMNYTVVVKYLHLDDKTGEVLSVSESVYHNPNKQDIKENGVLIAYGNTFEPLIYGADGDKINMEVYAVGDNGINSIRSLSVSYEITLHQHTTPVKDDFAVSFADGQKKLVIKWVGGESEAKRYGVSIGGAETVFTIEELKQEDDKIATININEGDYVVKIRALSGDRIDDKNWYLTSDTCLLKTFTVLRSLYDSDIRVLKVGENQVIEIDPVRKASGYDYKLQYYYIDDNDQVVNVGAEIPGSVAVGEDIVLAKPTNAKWVKLLIKATGTNAQGFDETAANVDYIRDAWDYNQFDLRLA